MQHMIGNHFLALSLSLDLFLSLSFSLSICVCVCVHIYISFLNNHIHFPKYIDLYKKDPQNTQTYVCMYVCMYNTHIFSQKYSFMHRFKDRQINLPKYTHTFIHKIRLVYQWVLVVHTFVNDISLKVNIIIWLEFRLI